MNEKPFLVSSSNTLIHKIRKLDLLVINGEDHTAVLVTYKGIKAYVGKVTDSKSDAKLQDMELLNLTSLDVFGEEKTLLFVQTINGKEYKVDYSKHGTSLFIKIHQENAF